MTISKPTDRDQIMIIAGEVSGDLHASGFLHKFSTKHPDFLFFGVGGQRMASAGCELLYSVDQVAFLGLFEILAHLPFIRKMTKRLLRECLRRKPRAIVLVDYPGFDLRFAEKIRRIPAIRETPILYYISPQVWAWHASRVTKIAKLVDRMAVIFDFEIPIYEEVGFKADFVGHPLLEITHPDSTKEAFFASLGLQSDTPLLALLPGSRAQEVRRLLPIFLDSFDILQHKIKNLNTAVGCSPSVGIDDYQRILASRGTKMGRIHLLQGRTYDLQAHSDVAMVASGTATLETAILGTPMVMAYKVAVPTYWIGRHLIKIPNIALVNVVAGKKVIPEFIQGDAAPHRIAEELADLLQNEKRRRGMIADLEGIRNKLGEPDASKKVAQILEEMINPLKENVTQIRKIDP